jgi:hypothetical protein
MHADNFYDNRITNDNSFFLAVGRFFAENAVLCIDHGGENVL